MWIFCDKCFSNDWLIVWSRLNSFGLPEIRNWNDDGTSFGKGRSLLMVRLVILINEIFSQKLDRFNSYFCIQLILFAEFCTTELAANKCH